MNITSIIVALSSLLAVQTQPVAFPAASPSLHVLSHQQYSLENRHPVASVNEVFADNILLTLSYLSGEITKEEEVDWDNVRQPSSTYFILKPGETFAFHDQLLDEYKDSVVKTTNAHFIWDEGFKSDGWLVGDGVCHLASFLHVAAEEAGLEVTAPTRHDFAEIPDVEKEDGTSIYFMPNNVTTSSRQNLYIKNTLAQPVAFVIEHTADNQISIEVSTVVPRAIN